MSIPSEAQPQGEPKKLRKTAAYYASFIGLGLTTSTLGPTLPNLSAQTGVTLGQASYLLSAHSLGYMLGNLFGGRLYDHFSGHRVQAGALLVMAGMMALVPTLPLLWGLAGVLLVLGIFEALVDVGGNTLLLWVHREKNGPFMNGLHFFFGVGAFLAPVIVAQALLRTEGIQWAYWLIALALLPVSAWLFSQPSPQIHRAASGTGQIRANAMLVGAIMLFYFINVGAEVSFAGWIASYAIALGITDPVGAAYLTSIFWGALTLGRLMAIPVAARVSARWILLFDMLLGVASLGVLMLWPGSYTITWIGAFGAGFSMASVFPSTLTLAERRMPISGRVTGLFFLGGSAGGTFFPWLIGQLYQPLGPQSVMTLIFGMLAAGLVVFAAVLMPASRR